MPKTQKKPRASASPRGRTKRVAKAAVAPVVSVVTLPDIKPHTPIAALDRDAYKGRKVQFSIEAVAPLVGMQSPFIKKVVGKAKTLGVPEVIQLLDQDAYAETFIPRSQVLDYLMRPAASASLNAKPLDDEVAIHHGEALAFIRSLPEKSVQCVVTSTPYWGLRLYKNARAVEWADKQSSVFGHEQTPEAFVRHTAEILHELRRVLTDTGSIWWNIMDSFNTRTQIRGNAAEALRAMQGKDKRRWSQHDCRRYSAGHAYLKDGEQCQIPSRIAERAARLGFFVKSTITWAKTSSLPEPQESRVSRNLEYVIHMTKVRTPLFNKSAYLELPASMGGRNNGHETAKLSDVWTLPTSSGRDGHGAQFPMALPARCIALSTREGDVVLDPFVGAGNAGVAAAALGRRFIGVDVSDEYLGITAKRIDAVRRQRDKTPLEQIALAADQDAMADLFE